MIEIDIKNRIIKGNCKAKYFKKEIDRLKDLFRG